MFPSPRSFSLLCGQPFSFLSHSIDGIGMNASFGLITSLVLMEHMLVVSEIHPCFNQHGIRVKHDKEWEKEGKGSEERKKEHKGIVRMVEVETGKVSTWVKDERIGMVDGMVVLPFVRNEVGREESEETY